MNIELHSRSCCNALKGCLLETSQKQEIWNSCSWIFMNLHEHRTLIIQVYSIGHNFVNLAWVIFELGVETRFKQENIKTTWKGTRSEHCKFPKTGGLISFLTKLQSGESSNVLYRLEPLWSLLLISNIIPSIWVLLMNSEPNGFDLNLTFGQF